jgi:hypothetical protein
VSERSRIPPGGLPQPLQVGYASGGSSSAAAVAGLPKAQTCFLTLSLPRYPSKAVLRAKLLYAIHNARTMETDAQVL